MSAFTLTAGASNAGLRVPEFNADDFGGIWDTARNIGADYSLSRPRNSATATTDALNSMQPIVASTNQNSDFWPELARTLTGYLIVRDATRNGVAVNSNGTAPVQPIGTVPVDVAQRSQASLSPLVLLGLVGLLAYSVARR